MARPSKQEIDDMRMAPKTEKAYNDADKTEPAPKSAGAGRGFVNPPMKSMAKGGSASARADGCAERGKTRGMMR